MDREPRCSSTPRGRRVCRAWPACTISPKRDNCGLFLNILASRHKYILRRLSCEFRTFQGLFYDSSEGLTLFLYHEPEKALLRTRFISFLPLEIDDARDGRVTIPTLPRATETINLDLMSVFPVQGSRRSLASQYSPGISQQFQREAFHGGEVSCRDD